MISQVAKRFLNISTSKRAISGLLWKSSSSITALNSSRIFSFSKNSQIYSFSTCQAGQAAQQAGAPTPCSVNPTTVIQHDDFYVEQHFTSCLASYAYYIESNGEAAIIDPLRETKPYLDIAARRGAKIKYILESHFHADFVSGHISLAKKTGASIVYGPQATAGYDIHVAKDYENLKLGNATIQVLHTPGHTTESSCFLLKDHKGNAHSVYTGDTLFLGEVGRPDLAVKSGSITEKDLAGWLFDSIKNKLLTLPDNVIVFPSHGAGSACGKNIGKGHNCDIGTQKKNNYALQPMQRDDFIGIVTHDLPKPPSYFFYDAGLNRNGYADLEDVSLKNYKPINGEQLNKYLADNKAILLDARGSIDDGYIQNSLNVGLNTPFAVWVGALVDPHTPLVLLAEEGAEEEAALRLKRIGFDHILGYLKGGFEAAKSSGKVSIQNPKILQAEQFIKITEDKSKYVLDVRSKLEYEAGRANSAKNIPLGELKSHILELPTNEEIFIYCQSGARSKMAITLLNSLGINNVTIARDGYPALALAGMK